MVDNGHLIDMASEFLETNSELACEGRLLMSRQVRQALLLKSNHDVPLGKCTILHSCAQISLRFYQMCLQYCWGTLCL